MEMDMEPDTWIDAINFVGMDQIAMTLSFFNNIEYNTISGQLPIG
jgi:hypothetical protein